MPKKVIAVVPAAGSGRRMASARPKQFLRLGGMPVLTHALLALEAADCIEAVVVAAPADEIQALRQECIEPFDLQKVVAVVPGGERRQDSVQNGLAKALELGAAWVAVHDGVRPLAGPELFGRVLEAARECGAAVAAIPCVDTIKRAGPDQMVQATLDRSKLWRVQTPQAFDARLLADALEKARQEGVDVTDEAGLFEWLGREVRLVMGQPNNLKITTPADLELAQGWLGGAMNMRSGQGLDVHRLAPGRKLILGGVEIPFELGLMGHSDADVLTHAVMDALLAAAALGDIGKLFPDSDPAHAGADSLALLEEVVRRLAEAGYRPWQANVTLAAERPKISPHTAAMAANLAARMGIEPGMVNVAATTCEGLGFLGRGEGMAALALCSIAPLAKNRSA